MVGQEEQVVKYLGNLRQVGWASQEPAGCQEGRGSTVRGRERGPGSACWVLPPAWYGVGPRLWGVRAGKRLQTCPRGRRRGARVKRWKEVPRSVDWRPSTGAEAFTKASAVSVRTSSPFLLLPKPSKSGCSAYRRPPSSFQPKSVLPLLPPPLPPAPTPYKHAKTH